jgi:predicted negative regulator of RcsB-dependent stress response
MWAGQGTPGNGRAWIAAAHPHLPESERFLRDMLLCVDATLAGLEDRWAEAHGIYQSLLGSQDPNVKVAVLTNVSFITWALGDLDGAWRYLDEAGTVADANNLWIANSAWVRGSLHLATEDFAAARDAFAAGAQRAGDTSTFSMYSRAALAAMEVVLGNPAEALAIIDETHDWDLVPIMSEDAVRALALAELGRKDEARSTAFAFARRASLGRLLRQANDALVCFGALAAIDGDVAEAHALLRAAAMPRSPQTAALSLHYGRRAGMGDEIAQMMDDLRASGERPDGRPALLEQLALLSSR